VSIETAMKKFSSYKNKKAVPDNQILNAFSEEMRQNKPMDKGSIIR
jgi:hypothetical protein